MEYVNFKDLNNLYLPTNNITDIKVLEKVKFENLESLSLSQNKIADINILENVNFRGLKKLFLYYTIIFYILVIMKSQILIFWRK